MEKLSAPEKAAKRLSAIKAGRKCKRLPVDATKAEIRAAHRAKIAAKKAARLPQPVEPAPKRRSKKAA